MLEVSNLNAQNGEEKCHCVLFFAEGWRQITPAPLDRSASLLRFRRVKDQPSTLLRRDFRETSRAPLDQHKYAPEMPRELMCSRRFIPSDTLATSRQCYSCAVKLIEQ